MARLGFGIGIILGRLYSELVEIMGRDETSQLTCYRV